MPDKARLIAQAGSSEETPLVHHLKRLEGLIFVCLGLLLYFSVIPEQTETISYGWLRPDTVPNLMAIVLALCGVWMTILPAARQDRERPRQMLVASFYTGVIALGVYCMSLWGFLIVSPFLSLAIMLALGERRLLWLSIGVAGLPALIWFGVDILLGRSLPA